MTARTPGEAADEAATVETRCDNCGATIAFRYDADLVRCPTCGQEWKVEGDRGWTEHWRPKLVAEPVMR